LLGAIVVPEDDITLYPFEPLSADAVREAITHAGLRFDATHRSRFDRDQSNAVSEEGHTNDTRR
jgi:hypothetical protein